MSGLVGGEPVDSLAMVSSLGPIERLGQPFISLSGEHSEKSIAIYAVILNGQGAGQTARRLKKYLSRVEEDCPIDASANTNAARKRY
jgi:hypothetical protein